jgi:DNA-binding FadR family transcriptional regulator
LQPLSKPDVQTGRPAPDRGYLRLAAQIHALVAQGEFAAGQRLPAERALAERFDVSRTSVREAIIALELQGVVEVRGGSGIYVCEAGPATNRLPAMPEPGAGPFELLRARCLIESEIAALAAATRTDADLDRIFEALTAMRDRMTDKAANAEADRRFHLGIAHSTGNSVLLATVTSMWDQARGPVWEKMEQHFHTQALRQASQADHQRIFGALVARDAQEARQAMRDHLERVIGEFAQGWR